MNDTLSRPGTGWGWMMAYGIVSLIAGLAAFAWPIDATFALAIVIGVAFLAAGVFSVAAGLLARGSEGTGYAILFGILSAIVGLIMIFEPATGAISFTMLVFVWLVVRGALELSWAFRVRRRRGWLIALGVINLLLAAYIIATFPLTALTLPGFLLGISFVFAGVDAMVAAAMFRRVSSPFG